MGKYERKRERKPRKALLIGLAVVLTVVLCLVLAAGILLGRINRADNSLPWLTQEDLDRLLGKETEAVPDGAVITDGVEFDNLNGELIGAEDGIFNVLLIGQDRRPGEERTRSDAMILCTINKKEKTITMTSFLRDLYVEIPGYQSNRLNVPYLLGGMELLDQTLELNYGVHVDANIEVDFSGFESVIDALGGVDVYLTEEEADYINNRSSDRIAESYFDYTEGVQKLTGEAALEYSRIRYLDSDFGRTGRQRAVLTAVIESCRNAGASELTAMATKLLPMVTTDMTNTQILSGILEYAPILKDCTIVTQRIPVDGSYYNAYIDGMAVLVAEREENYNFLKEALSPEK